MREDFRDDEVLSVALLRRRAEDVFSILHKIAARDLSNVLTWAADEIGRLNGNAQGPAKPVGRRWIVDLIRDQFDPKPSDYRPGDNWDDGAEAIADAVLAQLPLLRAEGSVVPSTHRGPTEPLQCLRCGTVDAFGPISAEKE